MSEINEYSLGTQFMIIFILNMLLYIKIYRRKNIFCFETLFSLTFLLSTFQYPFLMDFWSPYVINRFFTISSELYSEGMCIAMFGYLAFLLGAAFVAKRKTYDKVDIDFDDNAAFKLNSLFQYLTFITFGTMIITGGYKILYHYSSYNIDKWGNTGDLYTYIFIFFNLSSVLQLIKLKAKNVTNIRSFFIKSDNIFKINVLLIVPFFLLTGYRSELLSLILPLLLLYSLLINNIKWKNLFAMIIIGILLINIIKTARELSGGLLNISSIVYSFTQFNNISYLFSDLSSVNGALYFFVDYVNIHSITYGSNILLQVASFVPFLQSVIIEIFGFVPDLPSSLVFSETINISTSFSGLGTHIIGDLYYTFGLGGVIILMFALGWVVSLLYSIIYGKNSLNIYALITLCILFGNSIYFVRVEYFYIVRSIGFSLIIFWFFTLFFKMNRSVII